MKVLNKNILKGAQSEASDYWRNRATNFAGYYRDTKRPSIKKIVSLYLNTCTHSLISLAHISEDDIVLDVGCGPGVHMKLLAPRCKKIVGIDSSKEMLSEAERKLKNLDRHNWALHLADAQKIPFENKSFNWIISIGLLDYVLFPQEVLSEYYRLLTGPGFIIFTIPKRPSIFSFVRTPIGNIIKDKVLGLPPIINVVTSKELNTLLYRLNFYPCYIKSIWTMTWLVKATKR